MDTFIWFFVNTWKKKNWMWNQMTNQLKLQVLLLLLQLMILAPILWCFVLLKCSKIHMKVNRIVVQSSTLFSTPNFENNPIEILCVVIKGTILQSYSNFKHYNNSNDSMATISGSSNIMTPIILNYLPPFYHFNIKFQTHINIISKKYKLNHWSCKYPKLTHTHHYSK